MNSNVNLEKKEEEELLPLPKCFSENFCVCFKPIENEQINESDEHFLTKTLKWLKNELVLIELHINKDKFLNTSDFKYTRVGILIIAYKHLLSSFEFFSKNFNILPNTYHQLLKFKIKNDFEINISKFVSVVRNLCQAYCEMLVTFMKQDDFIDIIQLIYVMKIHVNCLLPLNEILIHLKPEINYLKNLYKI